MGDSKIQWTNKTWNPVTGCTKVSQGCKYCYAERVFPRAYGKERKFTDVRCHPDRLEQPLHWRKPSRVFVNSMSDLFHEDVSFEFIDQVFAVMALCPRHTFQILTKRPERMLEYLKSPRERWQAIFQAAQLSGKLSGDLVFKTLSVQPVRSPENIWLGVSCEDQKTADERISLLLRTPAAIRFVSYEPALQSVNLAPYLDLCRQEHMHAPERGCWERLAWVIVGGESGPHARQFHLEWARHTVEQCRAAGVACFVKQLGRSPYAVNALMSLRDSHGGDMSEWPEDLQVRQFPQ